MENSKLRKMCFLSGISFPEVHTAYLQALKEAEALGVDDEKRVMSILETILGIDEQNDTTSKKLTSKYLESGKPFDSFMEELVSSSIPQGVRPEPDITEPFPDKIKENENEDDEIDDGSYGNAVHGSEKNDDNIVDDDKDHY